MTTADIEEQTANLGATVQYMRNKQKKEMYAKCFMVNVIKMIASISNNGSLGPGVPGVPKNQPLLSLIRTQIGISLHGILHY